MSKLCRLLAMILLFWLLANDIWASHSIGAPCKPSSDALSNSRPESPRSEAALPTLVPPWYVDVRAGRVSDSGKRSPIEPDLQRALEIAETDKMIRVIVHVREPGSSLRSGPGGATAAQARARFVDRLQATAAESQAPLRSYLASQQVVGHVASYETLWITNAIAVRATPAVVRSLADQPSVVSVNLDHWRQWVVEETPRSVATSVEGPDSPQSVEWNISRVRADEVWHALHISGTGSVVAGMDTGVDWHHPALRSSYRGYNPHGPSNHIYSWYDATGDGANYPVDGHGHGTHTLGTAVGKGGIGVAPGARWIAVRMLSSQGYGYDSWIHAGFQWLLAPGGDPSKAPDVVNCSWGNDNPHLTTFQDDLRALRTAGILAVFANGNDGPERGSLSSPASLPEAFAVGASDPYDEVANFSSRGPSPWGEIRPLVSAPGVQVSSSTPGGAHASKQGTSMAAPHVSGLAALLRSVSPTLSITRTAYVITSTAVPIAGQVPNNDAGWGRVDAFAAVAAVARAGFISGTVREIPASESAAQDPIAGVTVTAVPRGEGGGGTDITTTDGAYRLVLAPGMYDVTASAFGHQSTTLWGVPVVADTTAVKDFALTPNPTGSLSVQVTDASSGDPVSATVAVLDTPYAVVTHSHTFDLPADTYTVRAHRLGYRVITATATISVGQTTAVDLALPEGPSILLVDSGGWYYESHAPYFRQALDDLSYAYDESPIRRLPNDIPLASDLTSYDVVIWSAPRDAPGYIGAGGAVSEYLEGGGRMLLTGQDVGFWDGGGASFTVSPYFTRYFKAQFVADNAPTRALRGLEGDIYAGTVITIAGPDGADNQDYPDVISVADPDAAASILMYTGGGCGGMRVGTCLDHRAIYLPFGFEAISDRVERRSVMGKTLDWLTAAPPNAGLEIQPQSQLRIGVPGSVVTHTLRVRHLGQGGSPDEIDLTLRGASWRTELSSPTLMLSPCTSTTLAVSVTIPVTATSDLQDVVTITARSSISPAVAVSAELTTKAPAPVLLVDDDRWYDQQETYEAAMGDVRLPYDLWQTSTSASGSHGTGPPLETLQRYRIVVWWTGYDWYAPITDDEEGSLQGYLDGGGRLFLSSQDFLYYHHNDPFSRDALGVLTYTEDITPTHVVGVSDNLIGERLGTWPLDYPPGYRNWSDGLVPTPETEVVFRDQEQRAIALARRSGEQAVVFLAFPFEALPADEQSLVMQRSIAWLSDLGRSTFEVDRRSFNPGDTRAYTITVRNDGPEPAAVSVSNTLPSEIAVDTQTLVGPGSYDSTERRISWRGSITPGEAVTLAYRATVLTPTGPGRSVLNTARFILEDQGLAFDRSAEALLNAPDLSPSTFSCTPILVRPGRRVTCTLSLVNAGPVTADEAMARIYPPGDYAVVPDSLWTTAGLAGWGSDGILWRGPLVAGGRATLGFEILMTPDPVRRALYGVAFLDDGLGRAWERPTWVRIHPWPVYAPLMLNETRSSVVQTSCWDD